MNLIEKPAEGCLALSFKGNRIAVRTAEGYKVWREDLGCFENVQDAVQIVPKAFVFERVEEVSAGDIIVLAGNFYLVKGSGEGTLKVAAFATNQVVELVPERNPLADGLWLRVKARLNLEKLRKLVELSADPEWTAQLEQFGKAAEIHAAVDHLEA